MILLIVGAATGTIAVAKLYIEYKESKKRIKKVHPLRNIIL